MDLGSAINFVRSRHQGTLVTIRGNGRPQLSNILFSLADDDLIEISVTDDRAKTRNLRRDPRASLFVPGDTIWSYVVVEAHAEVSAVAARPDDAVVEQLVQLYRRISGEHPDWDGYRRAMIEEGRVLLQLHTERAYGILPT
jgi:PPOX class probable F420-dependent enzyme